MKIKYLEDCLLIKDILVIGDLHLGYEGDFGSGFKEIIEKMERVFSWLEGEGLKIKKIVLLGDLKHDFGDISNDEWRESLEFLDVMIEKVGVKNVIVLKGNHDLKLGPVLRKRGLRMREYYKIRLKSNSERDKEVRGFQDKESSQDVLNLSDTKELAEQPDEVGCGARSSEEVEILFLHGHTENFLKKISVPSISNKKKIEDKVFRQLSKQGLKNNSKGILILGHLHPSISLTDEYKKEKYKCFLYGNWKGFIVYILPSFSSRSYGYDLSNLGDREDSFGGRSKQGHKRGHNFFIISDSDLMKFNVVVYDEKEGKELEFGGLRGLIKNMF